MFLFSLCFEKLGKIISYINLSGIHIYFLHLFRVYSGSGLDVTSIGSRDRAELPAPPRAPRLPPPLPRAPAGTVRRPGWTRILALAALGVAGALPGVPGAADRLAGPLPAQVVSVLDGDTLEVRVHIWLGQSLSTRVRLAGIDAPELRGKCDRERDLARRARARLDPADAGARDGAGAVRLREVRYGKFAGRVLARVETLDGTDLGQGLLGAGLARPYDGRRRASWCGGAAATADSG